MTSPQQIHSLNKVMEKEVVTLDGSSQLFAWCVGELYKQTQIYQVRAVI